MRRKICTFLVAAGAAIALVVASIGQAASTATINGTVGPGFTIKVSPKSVKAGKYTFKIQDKSDIHNFHITGPGVNKKTSVSATGTTTWNLTLKKGTYTIVCDPHASSMKTTLKVT
jgi:plastocyanin